MQKRVNNAMGQRPVENFVGSSVSLRYGGMQTASRSRVEMFGDDAPVWHFLDQFGGPADPLTGNCVTGVIETYPVLAMIALGWTRPVPNRRYTGRLPKYNPGRKKTFSIEDWQHVCASASKELSDFKLNGLANWIGNIRQKEEPKKKDQDCVDACINMIVALRLTGSRKCLMVGDVRTGYIVVPHSPELHEELAARCEETGRVPAAWTRAFRRRARTIVQHGNIAGGACSVA
jgi:predicted RNase H-like nuclease